MTNEKIHIERHKDGSIWARGKLINGRPNGLWKWYRKDGTIMRSGHFDNGRQVGIWITYTKDGVIVKTTIMKKAK